MKDKKTRAVFSLTVTEDGELKARVEGKRKDLLAAFTAAGSDDHELLELVADSVLMTFAYIMKTEAGIDIIDLFEKKLEEEMRKGGKERVVN